MHFERRTLHHLAGCMLARVTQKPRRLPSEYDQDAVRLLTIEAFKGEYAGLADFIGGHAGPLSQRSGLNCQRCERRAVPRSRMPQPMPFDRALAAVLYGLLALKCLLMDGLRHKLVRGMIQVPVELGGCSRAIRPIPIRSRRNSNFLAISSGHIRDDHDVGPTGVRHRLRSIRFPARSCPPWRSQPCDVPQAATGPLRPSALTLMACGVFGFALGCARHAQVQSNHPADDLRRWVGSPRPRLLSVSGILIAREDRAPPGPQDRPTSQLIVRSKAIQGQGDWVDARAMCSCRPSPTTLRLRTRPGRRRQRLARTGA